MCAPGRVSCRRFWSACSLPQRASCSSVALVMADQNAMIEDAGVAGGARSGARPPE